MLAKWKLVGGTVCIWIVQPHMQYNVDCSRFFLGKYICTHLVCVSVCFVCFGWVQSKMHPIRFYFFFFFGKTTKVSMKILVKMVVIVKFTLKFIYFTVEIFQFSLSLSLSLLAFIKINSIKMTKLCSIIENNDVRKAQIRMLYSTGNMFTFYLCIKYNKHTDVYIYFDRYEMYHK